jgi:NAD(P)-dependent dehydrogenase (short-subunit alcohol dehydrogenase family)
MHHLKKERRHDPDARDDPRGPLPGHESRLEPKPEWEPRYAGSERLKGKVAIVTGADSGIGRAVAALYAREGADVAIVYLLEEDDAKETQRIVEAEGQRAITIKADVGSRKMCEHVAQRVLEVFGQIDILVNNAGEQHPDDDITDITEEQLHRTFQTNIFGMFHMVQAVRPYLTQGAAIINCTSVTMYEGAEDLLDYSATKGAITAFTRSLSENLIGEGIRVNAVAPGPIWTRSIPAAGRTRRRSPISAKRPR